jgi:hypothetical protein
MDVFRWFRGRKKSAERIVSPIPPDRVPASGLPRAAIAGKLPIADGAIDPAKFRPNPSFVEVLHRVIGTVGPQDPGLIAEAQRTRSGWLYVIAANASRIDDRIHPEDIIGSFPVSDGKVDSATYQPNPKLGVFTARGLVRLPPTLEDALIATLLGA